MRLQVVATATLGLCAAASLADAPASFDAARAFGARPDVAQMRLAPDGKSVAYLAPVKGQGTAVYTLGLAEGSKPHIALVANGAPDRITWCTWVANDRLACEIEVIVREPELLTLQYLTRLLAVNADGSNPRVLSKRSNSYSRGVDFGGGRIIDWLPDQDGVVLMTRFNVPDDHVGSRLGSSDQGLAVDLVDTRTLAVKSVEPPHRKAWNFISDGRGELRVMALDRTNEGSYSSGTASFLYRRKGSHEWEPLSTFDWAHQEGFEPLAVDPELDVAYGFKKKDGRKALYKVALDGSLAETLVFAHETVDVSTLDRIGKRQRVVGVEFVTATRHEHYVDAGFEKLVGAISRALPSHPALSIIDSSVDESKLLIFAESDQDAGAYYLLDRQTHQLQTFLVVRGALERVTLAKVKPVTYKAGDGTLVPAYLTLPPGVEQAKSLPAIVLPHGGPSARDEWGFDWLPQFFANQGYVVLQPEFRGSAGYGDSWFNMQGYKQWPVAIGDVLDAGRWLVAEGIANPSQLAIVGWSYGGYAALQSAVTDPTLFKAVIAIAPVTDLVELKEEHRRWSDFYLWQDFIGEGPKADEGSPARNAHKFKAPVLIFHGTDDVNVNYRHSALMDKSLTVASVPHELVTFEHLDHHLVDSEARIAMLKKSADFLRQALHR